MTDNKKATPEEKVAPNALNDADYVQGTAFERVTAALDGVRVSSPTQAMACCPAHDDKNPSLSIRSTETRVLLHCFAGCEFPDVLDALGMTKADTFHNARTEYRYDDGRVVTRTNGKEFRQSGVRNKTAVLYRLDKVEAAVKAEQTVYLVEGEEDVHALESLGVTATTAPQGGGNFDKVDVSPLKGATVVAIPDRDATGKKWSESAWDHLHDYAASLTFMEVKVGKDFSDHLAAGHGIAELTDMLAPKKPDKARLDGYVFDCNDLAALPAPVPLMEGVLDVSTIAMLAGKFGTYKTFLALSWAASLATGRAWGNQAVPVAVPVLYIAAEGVTGIRGRLAAWQSAHGPIPRGMLTVVARPVRLTEESDVAEVRELIESTGARLVVFDTLHRCAPGVEENSAKEMGVVIDRVASLRDDTGCTVLLLHHTGHEGRRARGSSVNEDDIDSSFVVRLTGDEEDRGMDNQRVLEHRKRKDGELLEPIPLKLVVVEGTESGYLTVANVFSTVGDRKASKVQMLVAKANKMRLPVNLSAAKTLDAFRSAGSQITKWESEQVAKIRKSAPLPEDSPNSPHPHRGDARGIVGGPSLSSPNVTGNFSGNSELGKLDTPRNSPEEAGNDHIGHSPEAPRGIGEPGSPVGDILALAQPVPEGALLCETCGSKRELVPPALLWFACRTCHPATFSRG